MNQLSAYLQEQLEEKLQNRRIVVWYDTKAEFNDFIDSLGAPRATGADLPSVTPIQLSNTKVNFVRFEGSFYGLKFALEPFFAVAEPNPALVYVPGVERDLHESVLMEIERAGGVFDHNFKRTVRQVLKAQLSDGEIDEIINRPSLTYADVAGLLEQGAGTTISILKVIFAGASDNAALLAAWLADHSYDAPLTEKQGQAELYKLASSRLGLDLDSSTALPEGRDKTLRFVLVNEFRSDLQGAAEPLSIGRIPKPATAEQIAFCHRLAQVLRKQHASTYALLADKIEQGLGLAGVTLNAETLGSVDTFRFEELALLTWCGELIHNRSYVRALELVRGRSDCFWVRQDVNRQAQWGACRLMAELGRRAQSALADVTKLNGESKDYVKAYAEDWCEADQLHRQMESWVAKMPSDPETEQALVTVRGDYDALLREQSVRFSKAFQSAGWTVPGCLQQTRIYHEVVGTGGGPVAYFLVDALRYEMGLELRRLLGEAKEMSVRAAIAALPSITTIGMAALLPGAESSFSVVEFKNQLAARVGGVVMASWADRWKYLKTRVPDAVEMTLDDLTRMAPGRLSKAVSNASLVIVRSQELDQLGESGEGGVARQLMDTVLNNLARCVRKLATAGIGRFVIAADHGHLFGEERGPDMQTDNPGGQALEMKRRCWIGRGGQTPPSTVRVSGSELGYETDLEFVFPKGMAVLPAHSGLQYHHGGFSLQELVIPVLSFRMAVTDGKKSAGQVAIKGVPLELTNRVFSVSLEMPADLVAGPLAIRVFLFAGEEVVGKVGMVSGAELDRESDIVRLTPGKAASIGLLLAKDDCQKVKVAVLNAATDALLAQSEEIPIRLAI